MTKTISLLVISLWSTSAWAGPVELRVSFDKQSYRLGEIPTVTLTVVNNSSAAISVCATDDAIESLKFKRSTGGTVKPFFLFPLASINPRTSKEVITLAAGAAATFNFSNVGVDRGSGMDLRAMSVNQPPPYVETAP